MPLKIIKMLLKCRSNRLLKRRRRKRVEMDKMMKENILYGGIMLRIAKLFMRQEYKKILILTTDMKNLQNQVIQ